MLLTPPNCIRVFFFLFTIRSNKSTRGRWLSYFYFPKKKKSTVHRIQIYCLQCHTCQRLAAAATGRPETDPQKTEEPEEHRPIDNKLKILYFLLSSYLSLPEEGWEVIWHQQSGPGLQTHPDFFSAISFSPIQGVLSSCAMRIYQSICQDPMQVFDSMLQQCPLIPYLMANGGLNDPRFGLMRPHGSRLVILIWPWPIEVSCQEFNTGPHRLLCNKVPAAEIPCGLDARMLCEPTKSLSHIDTANQTIIETTWKNGNLLYEISRPYRSRDILLNELLVNDILEFN